MHDKKTFSPFPGPFKPPLPHSYMGGNSFFLYRFLLGAYGSAPGPQGPYWVKLFLSFFVQFFLSSYLFLSSYHSFFLSFFILSFTLFLLGHLWGTFWALWGSSGPHSGKPFSFFLSFLSSFSFINFNVLLYLPFSGFLWGPLEPS
jgi:hypothetical protein